jgi:hypothetical protein
MGWVNVEVDVQVQETAGGAGVKPAPDVFRIDEYLMARDRGQEVGEGGAHKHLVQLSRNV